MPGKRQQRIRDHSAIVATVFVSVRLSLTERAMREITWTFRTYSAAALWFIGQVGAWTMSIIVVARNCAGWGEDSNAGVD